MILLIIINVSYLAVYHIRYLDKVTPSQIFRYVSTIASGDGGGAGVPGPLLCPVPGGAGEDLQPHPVVPAAGPPVHQRVRSHLHLSWYHASSIPVHI